MLKRVSTQVKKLTTKNMSVCKYFELVPAESLFISEPNPYMFGNSANEPSNPSWTNENWLKSRFHFSFAEYHDSERSQFGALRVMNDDLVQPSRGFGSHPHRDMEIVTYIVSGELSHKDSSGREESLPRGSVQFMSAGNGVVHSEMNQSPTDPTRFVQMWIMPNKRGHSMQYGSLLGDEEKRRNKWQHMVSSMDSKVQLDTPIKLHQDANIFVGEFEPGTAVGELPINEGRIAYVLCVEGENVKMEHVELGGSTVHATETLKMHDGARVYGPGVVRFTPTSTTAHMLVVEMQQ